MELLEGKPLTGPRGWLLTAQLLLLKSFSDFCRGETQESLKINTVSLT